MFHTLEFWGTFVFSVVTCISLTSTPKSILNIYDNPLTLRLVLFFNIVAASLPAVLVSLNYGTLSSMDAYSCYGRYFSRDRHSLTSHDQYVDFLPTTTNENTHPETHPDQRHKCRNTTTKSYRAHSPLPRVLRNRKPRDRVPQRGHDELRGPSPALVALRDRGADVNGVDGVHREPRVAGAAGGVQLHG